MRKLLLCSLLIFSAGVFAQNQLNREAQLAPHKAFARQVIDAPTGFPAKPYNVPAAKSPDQKLIGSSANIYTLLVETTTCLTANEDLDLLMFTSRANPSSGVGTSSGNIVSAISSNGGHTWDNLLIVDDAKANRYPSGVIYNPTGNTNVNNAYAVVCGPTTDGSAWIENFWGSMKLDGTNKTLNYEDYTVAAQDFPRYGMATTGSGHIHVLGNKYTFTSGVGITDFPYLMMNNGTFDATTNTFDWNRVKIYNTYANPGQDGTYHVSTYSTAWSPDGSVGYVWVLGIDSANSNTSYQPIVWRSVDHGATWTKLPFYNFANNTNIYNNIWATLADPMVKRPYFNSEFDAVVDNNGNLHLVGVITGAYSTHDDSLGFFYKWEPKHMYHVYTTAAGWEADQIGTIYTLNVLGSESGYGAGNDGVGWDHRVQMSRTADGTKIFAVWADSDTLYYQNVAAPNINMWGKDLTNNNVYPATDFTTGTLLDGSCFFHYVSNITFEDANGNFLVPVTFAALGMTPLDPVYHYYITSMGYGSTIGLDKIDINGGLSIAGVFPNPAEYNTEIRLHNTASVNTSLEIYSLTGQKVMEKDFGVLQAGEHKLAIDVQSLNSGIYVYVVRAGNEKESGKLVRR